MANGNEDISRSRRRFLEAIVASAVAVDAGVLGYELGRELIKCPQCPSYPQSTTATQC
ncbi:hypothetical protein JCM16161A_02610 [Vulcanisaeta sp. JCM 16161]|uniref:hypothetical protein n=1 Tax=Vulcanisaeta sp. JCM 16161 TaxID=1295372 RepID=UPI000AE3D427|nr:hypothetical protein [Vulcanisaeta sp. JCM 16161]